MTALAKLRKFWNDFSIVDHVAVAIPILIWLAISVLLTGPLVTGVLLCLAADLLWQMMGLVLVHYYGLTHQS